MCLFQDSDIHFGLSVVSMICGVINFTMEGVYCQQFLSVVSVLARYLMKLMKFHV